MSPQLLAGVGRVEAGVLDDLVIAEQLQDPLTVGRVETCHREAAGALVDEQEVLSLRLGDGALPHGRLDEPAALLGVSWFRHAGQPAASERGSGRTRRNLWTATCDEVRHPQPVQQGWVAASVDVVMG